MLPAILTLTMNPALDVSTSTEKVTPEHKLRCGATRLDPGGGGVNVSRVVHRLGGRTRAVYAVGGLTGGTYRSLIEAEGVPTVAVPIGGETRESFTVDELSSGQQFRFVLEGPLLSDTEWSTCLDTVVGQFPGHGFVVASGSLPPGVPDDFYARLAREAGKAGLRTVVDASGDALAAALEEGVYLVAPSRRELATLVGHPLDGESELIEAATELVRRGSAECVALTLGGAGAVLATAEGVIRMPVPQVEVQSTVGAGDSFLGAFVLRIAQGRGVRDAMRSAVAAGSATAMTPATELCTPDDVAALEDQLESAGH